MAFNINEFHSMVSRRGLAKNNLFFARITLPQSVQFIEQNITSRELSFLCKTTDLPSFELDFQEIRNQGIGKPEKRPTDFRGGELSSIFMVDSKFGTLKFFQRWMQSIVNYNSYDGYFREDPQGKLPYEFGYKEDYAATMEIVLFSGNDADLAYYYKFGNVFPLNIGNVTASWENQAEVMTLPVQFAYDKFKTDAVELGQVRSDFSRSNGFLTYISSINAFGQAINQISRPQSIQDFINQATNVNTIFNAL